jgi:clan AA aspartic protease (TIGR02281 family)
LKIVSVIVIFVLGLTVGMYLQEISTGGRSAVGFHKKQDSRLSQTIAIPPKKNPENDNEAANIASSDITELFEEGDYNEILHRLRIASASGSPDLPILLEQLIKNLEKIARGGQLEAVRDLLLQVREMHPYEPRLHYLAAELALVNEDYSTAIALFYDLRDSRQEMFSERQINKQLDLLIDAYRYRLQKLQQTDKLLLLYQLVTFRDPTRPDYFYELAKLHYELRNLEQAKSSLSYILSDQVWANRAQELLSQINRFEMLQSKYHSQIPLHRSGKHFILTGLIDDVHEVTLLLDTGASYTTLKPELLKELGLSQAQSSPVTLETGGGRITAQLYSASTMSIGDQSLSNIVIAGVPLGSGIKADGLLGMNFLSNFEFFLDQEDLVLYLRLRTN